FLKRCRFNKRLPSSTVKKLSMTTAINSFCSSNVGTPLIRNPKFRIGPGSSVQDSSNFESSPTRSPHRRTASSKSPFPVVLQRARFMRAREVFMLSKFTIIAFLGIFIGAFTSTALAQENRCPGAATAKFEKPLVGPHWTGWGVTVSQQRFQPADMARLSAANTPKLKLKWAFGFPDVTQA